MSRLPAAPCFSAAEGLAADATIPKLKITARVPADTIEKDLFRLIIITPKVKTRLLMIKSYLISLERWNWQDNANFFGVLCAIFNYQYNRP